MNSIFREFRIQNSGDNTNPVPLGKEADMLSTNTTKSPLMVLGGILILALMAFAGIKSGHFSDFVNLYGFLFVLVGGIALILVGFSFEEIRCAFSHVTGASGNDAEIRRSIYFWEAAGRNFWMLGGLHCVLGIILGFDAMKTEENAGVSSVLGMMSRSLLDSFYGILLALICFIPCWKLIERLSSGLSDIKRDASIATIGRVRFQYRMVIGYVLFFAAFFLTIPNLSTSLLWNTLPVIVYWPALLVVLGGTLALALFIGGIKSGPPLSMTFAFMGLIGFLTAFIQMLFGITSAEIRSVVSATVFILSSLFVALLGMLLLGAPMEDYAVRTGRVVKPSIFSRVSWYGLPLLTLILVPLMIVIITTPIPRNQPQVTEVSASIQEQKVVYESRAPQSEPVKIEGDYFQKQHLIYKVNPAYPEQAKRAGIQGTIKLRIIINEEGFVYEVKGNLQNNPVLEQAAIPAVKRWRFSPFLMRDVPAAIDTTATVHFALK
jgi:TonB family protein